MLIETILSILGLSNYCCTSGLTYQLQFFKAVYDFHIWAYILCLNKCISSIYFILKSFICKRTRIHPKINAKMITRFSITAKSNNTIWNFIVKWKYWKLSIKADIIFCYFLCVKPFCYDYIKFVLKGLYENCLLRLKRWYY